MSIAPKNWKEFQHYKNRAPQWIKLHRRLLDDFEFASLPVASRALAPMLWLLASEYEDGVITASMQAVAFRFRMTVSELENTLKPLVLSGFFVTDSDLLAECKQSASLEKEREIELEKEGESGASAPAKPKREKSDRRAAKTRLPSSAELPQNYREHAQSQGLSETATAREWSKFRDHAEREDRLCAGERGWFAAWRGWIAKAIEFSPAIVSKTVKESVVSNDQWRERCRHWRDTGQWIRDRWGDAPGEPHCRVPAQILADFAPKHPQERALA